MNMDAGARILQRLPASLALWAALLATVACLSGCDRTARKAAGPPEKVSIAVVQTFYPALIFIAQAKGYFRDEGLDVTVQLHPTGPSALDALVSGTADLASTAETPVMFRIAGGDRLAILAQTFVSDQELALVARKDQGIGAPADLKGKRIAVTPGTVGEYFLSASLAVSGIALNEVAIVKLAPAELVDALLAGRVDAAASWNPWLKKLQRELGDRGVSFSLAPPHALLAVLSARPDLPAQQPAAVRGILRALVRAEGFAGKNPRESIQIVADTIGMAPDQLGEVWRPDDFRLSLEQSLLLSLEGESRWAIKNGLTSAKQIPDFFDLIYFEGLKAVRPEAVKILR